MPPAGGRTAATTRAPADRAPASGGDEPPAVAHRAAAAPRTHAHTGGDRPGRTRTSLLLSLIEMDLSAIRLRKQGTLIWPPSEVVDWTATRRGQPWLRGRLSAAQPPKTDQRRSHDGVLQYMIFNARPPSRAGLRSTRYCLRGRGVSKIRFYVPPLRLRAGRSRSPVPLE